MISVCLATYNGEEFLREQIDSILHCLHPSDELVISDDCSTDGTIEIINEYLAQDRRIRFVGSCQNGVIGNFEKAISASKGEIIFLSDQDDIWEENKVQAVVDGFYSDPEIMVVTHDANLIDQNGDDMGVSLFELRGSRSGFLKNIIKNSYVGCCMAFRRELLECAMPIPRNIEMHDWWIGLWGEMVGKTLFLSEPLIRYRRHAANVSSLNHYPLIKMLSNRIGLLEELLKRYVTWRRR